MPRWRLSPGAPNQRHRCLQLLPPECVAEGLAPGVSRSLRLPSGPRSRAPCWRTRRSRSTSWKTCSPPATSPEPGGSLAARGHPRLLQPARDRGFHLGRGQPFHRADGRCAHASRGCRGGLGRRTRELAAGVGCRLRPARRTRLCAHARRAGRPRYLRRVRATTRYPSAIPACASCRSSVPCSGPLWLARLCRGSVPAWAACRAFAARSGRSSACPVRSTAASSTAASSPGQTQRGAFAGLDLSLRAGFGLEGAMGEAGDGLVYGSIGIRNDSPSTNRFNNAVAQGRQLQRRHPGPRGTVLARSHALLCDPRRPAADVAALPHQSQDLHQHGGRRRPTAG